MNYTINVVRFYVITILASLLVILGILVLAFYDSSQLGLKHYYGDTTDITADQYLSILFNENTNLSHWILDDGKPPVFRYDFHSSSDYDYLDNSPINFYNTYAFNSLVKTNLLYILVGGHILCALIVILTRNKIRLIYRVTGKIRRYFERLQDKKIKVIPEDYNIITDINKSAIDYKAGLVCVRSWDLNSKFQLTSIAQGNIWEFHYINADRLPDSNNSAGIYGYRIGSSIKTAGKIMGIVEIAGNYQYHTDIVRGEYCRILCLFMSKGYYNTAKVLSAKYNVPVYLAEDNETAYLEWLYSKQGLKALEINYNVFKERNNGS